MQLNIVFTILGLCAAVQEAYKHSSPGPQFEVAVAPVPSQASSPAPSSEIEKSNSHNPVAISRQVVHWICIVVSSIVMLQIGKLVFLGIDGQIDDESHFQRWWRGDNDYLLNGHVYGGPFIFKFCLILSCVLHALGIIYSGIEIAFIHQEVNAERVVLDLSYIVIAVCQSISLSEKWLVEIAEDEKYKYQGETIRGKKYDNTTAGWMSDRRVFGEYVTCHIIWLSVTVFILIPDLL